MLIVSTEGDTGLPQVVSTWLENGLSKGTAQPGAVVAVVSESGNRAASSTTNVLQRLAETHHLDFFTNCRGWESTVDGSFFEQGLVAKRFIPSKATTPFDRPPLI